MKKYIKPSIEIVSLKSSVDIAATYKGIRQNLINQVYEGQTYTVTQYALGSIQNAEVDA